jgi:hypothetical protein
MPVTDPGVAFCLRRIGKGTAGLSTLIVAGAADTPAPAEDLWAAWADLERWPAWSPLHRSAAWTTDVRLAAGARFDQQISLGFPVAVLRPLVARRWDRLFQGAVDGLIRHASAGQQGPAR